MKNIKKYILAVLLCTLAIILLYLGGVLAIAEFALSLLVYFFIFSLFYFTWKKFRKQEAKQIPQLLEYFLFRVVIFLVFTGVALGSFSYYHNEISPAPMPQFTLTNGDKTVIFQAMSHIGSREFYNQIKEDITSAKTNDYVYFFEGVKPGTAENQEKFNTALGIKFDPDLYKNFSKLYGVDYQDNSLFFNLVNNLDFNVDISLDKIIELYEALPNEADGKNIPSELPIDANKEIVNSLAELNERQLKVLRYVNKAILNTIIKSDTTQSIITNTFSNKKLFSIILDKRNEVVAKEIISSEYKKIYTTYGLLHFTGVLELLQEHDANWKIINQKNYYPIK